MIFTTKYALSFFLPLRLNPRGGHQAGILLFNVPIDAAVSQAASTFCVCMMKGAPGVIKSCDTCPDIPIWLKNKMSSHSNIGH